MKRILVTGAAGGVSGMIRPLLRTLYADIVLSDLKPITDLASGETSRPADLADMAQVLAAVEGVDGIVHLGGFSVEGPWETILNANLIGCYHLFEAARLKGVKRVVFASSNHVMGFHPRYSKIGIGAVPRPDSRYGVSKLFGEGLGALYADKHGLGVLSIRIGNVGTRPIDKRRLAIWLHPEDLVQLIRIGFERPNLGYEVVYGCSANERAWWDNTRAYELGYRPRHHAEDHAAFALAEQAKAKADPIGDQFQGGTFCSDETTHPRCV